MTLLTERLKVGRQFSKNANIAKVMDLSGGALFALFANSFGASESRWWFPQKFRELKVPIPEPRLPDGR